MNPIPNQMRAAVSRRYGRPEVVTVQVVPTPEPGGGQILVRVRATTVNRTDCGYRGGKPFLIRFFSGLRRPKVPTWGTEFAGEVVALGDEVTGFAVGQRICGYCEGTFGAHAEFLAVAANRLIVPIPEGRTYAEVAPSAEGSHYALSTLRHERIGPASDVLVYGATGAIGSAAVQLAKDLGARVTAVCATPNLEMVKGLGADRVVDYTREDFTRDRQRYDLVFDAVGKSSFWRCRRLLKPKGAYSATDRPLARIPFLALPVLLGWLLMSLISPLFGRRRVVFVGPHSDPEGMAYLREFIASGRFRPVIDRAYPLEQIVDAYRYVETGQKIGNVVIEVG